VQMHERTQAQTSIISALSLAMEACAVPGAIVAAQRGDESPVVVALGTDARGRLLKRDTIVPVASVTKLALALTILRLVDDGLLNLDAPLRTYLPEAAAAQPGVTLRGLLSHTTGLPLGSAETTAVAYGPDLNWQAVVEGCLHVQLEAPPNTRVAYSPIGSCLAGAVVERILGQPFQAAVATVVFEPLGITDAYLGTEPPRRPALVADIPGAAGTPIEHYNSRFHQSLGLPSNGLLATAEAVLALLGPFQDRPNGFLRPETRRAAITSQTGNLAGGMPNVSWARADWGLGPEIRGHKAPHWAPDASPDAFGHSGATGSLAYVDPSSDVTWVILSTRAGSAAEGWAFGDAGIPAISRAVLHAFRKKQT
jgi:CubicO group peptidase (beta-lactamase class C family)